MDHRVYSPAQLSIAQLFANWMQASYLPTGALGDVIQIRNRKLSPYNQSTAALPRATGHSPSSTSQLKYGVNKKIELADERQHQAGASRPTGSTGFPRTPSTRRSTTTSRCRPSEQQGYGTRTARESGRRLPPSGAGTVSHASSCANSGRRQQRSSSCCPRTIELPFVKITKGRVPASRRNGHREEVRRPRSRRSLETTRAIREASTTSWGT